MTATTREEAHSMLQEFDPFAEIEPDDEDEDDGDEDEDDDLAVSEADEGWNEGGHAYHSYLAAMGRDVTGPVLPFD